MTQPFQIWAVADTRRGVENQAMGLAEALAAETAGEAHRAVIREDGFVTLPDSERPDIWIGCGRPAIQIAEKQRRAFNDTRFVYVQDPRGKYGLFDAIVAPEHDRLRRRNSVSMIGSPNRLNAAKLKDAEAAFANQLANYPAPRIAMLIGGPSKRLKLTKEIESAILGRARAFLDQGHSLLVSTSRRTPSSLLRALAPVAEHPRCWLHTGDGENPYFAFLAAADWIFVTEESTNMLTEAAWTGKPVYSLPLEGNPGKFRLLHAALETEGALRPYLGKLETWNYVPLDETRRIAKHLAKRFT